MRRAIAVAGLALAWLASGGSPATAQIFPTTTTTEVVPTTSPTTRPTTSTTVRPSSTTATTGASTSTSRGTSSTTSSTVASRTSLPVLPPVSLSPAEAEEPPPEAQGTGDISGVFPLLSLLGFAVVAGLLGTRWWQTRS